MKNKKFIIQTTIYKWRYVIGYIGVALATVSFLAMTGLYVPSGISEPEIESTITSYDLTVNNVFTDSKIIELPYRFLQKASISLLGLSNFSIAMPSMFIAAVASLALFILISDWTNRRAAVLSTLIIIISSRYAFLAQYGTPIITHISLSIILVAILSRIIRKAEIIIAKHISKAKLTKRLRVELGILIISLFATSALISYSRLGIFTVFIVVATMMFHPHARSSFRKIRSLIPSWYFWAGGALGVALLSPLVLAVTKNPIIISELLMVNEFNFNFTNNIIMAVKEFLDIRSSGHGIYIGPWFNLSALILIIIGFWRQIKTAHDPRSAMIIMWVLSSMILLLFSPSSHIVLFTPLALSLSMGLNYIVKSWYNIFPFNPYARILGLIPILLIISSLVIIDIKAYVDAYRYQPGVANQFYDDLSLLGNEMKKTDGAILIVSPNQSEQKFYQIYVKFNPKLTLSDTYSPRTNLRQIATQQAHKNLNVREIDRILANPFINQADRFYVYKKSVN